MDERRECGEPHARTRSRRLAGAGRRARAHDMRMNGPPESGPSPCGDATSFCRLNFLVAWLLSLESIAIYSQTRPYKRHLAANIHIIPVFAFASFHSWAAFSSLHPDRRCASAIRRSGLRNPSPSRSCTGRGRIRFLGSILTRLLVIFWPRGPWWFPCFDVISPPDFGPRHLSVCLISTHHLIWLFTLVLLIWSWFIFRIYSGNCLIIQQVIH
jgi:hypothetical protein